MSGTFRKHITRALYIGASLIFLTCLVGYELFWRYDQHLHIVIASTLRDDHQISKTLRILETSESAVDTSRREFKDLMHGQTTVSCWLNSPVMPSDSSQRVITLTLQGKYISEARPIHVSNDSSTQVLLIPNTVQGLPSGYGQIIYLKNETTLELTEFTGFLADIDKDGNEEVNMPERGGWMKLDPASGNWVTADLKPRKTTP